MNRRLLILGGATVLLLGLVFNLPLTSSPSDGTGSDHPEVAATHRPAEPTPSDEDDQPDHEPEDDFDQVEPPRPDLNEVYGGIFNTRKLTGSDSVALTFDDGPHPEWTPQVLAQLRQHDIKATFCLIGKYAENHPDLVAQIHADGHTLCNHSWLHEMDLGEQSPNVIRENLERTNDAIRAAVPDAEIPYFRHAGGNWTLRVVHISEQMGMESIHWDVDPRDWDVEHERDDIYDDLVAATEPGSIVLLHDGASNQEEMYEALRKVLPYWISHGLDFTEL
ncbi:polysaccharide deacetylase family protein [Natronoglycomyces albus]|uniref:Polysaccharide deacetylase family protein n=1 Tax=Natronoglycomyces albus TaxID=2811108 RepID=A0A895XHQ4_9ACTN|nr:polysaccharide deacetylase family protein [Natronoglycomyces albus]QSB04874.1 polysaccharide deacetylase family protein [Natronoglycomyces albus]